MSTLTKSQERSIAVLLERVPLAAGLGTEEKPCSVAAINLALSETLTARIPGCMSEVVGEWIIAVQDNMPDEMRNSVEWKRLLPRAAGTGRTHEEERIAILVEWMWTTVLAVVQPTADEFGFGRVWAEMLRDRTIAAALEAKHYAERTSDHHVASCAAAALAVARDSAFTDFRYHTVDNVATMAADAAYSTPDPHLAWESFDVCGVLSKLIEAG